MGEPVHPPQSGQIRFAVFWGLFPACRGFGETDPPLRGRQVESHVKMCCTQLAC
jgi:hypothetical protein